MNKRRNNQADNIDIDTEGGAYIGGNVNASRDIIGRDFIQIVNNPKQALHNATEQQLSDRKKMLHKVKNFWIDGVLNNSLHDAVWLELGMQYTSEAVEHPWKMILQRQGYTNEPIEPCISLYSIFEKADRALLVLGNPGSGKTTTLLKLTEELIAIAENDSQASIPIVFNLSSWSFNPKPLGEWMVDELANRYHVPRQTAIFWVQQNIILPLLDGLDEVKDTYRSQCIETINAHMQQTGFVDIIVCSRIQEYEAISSRLQLNAAVIIQPLTIEQIDQYLSGGGDSLIGARKALQQDGILQKLAETPLFLSIIAMAYRNMTIEEILNNSNYEQRRRDLFNVYIGRMLHHWRASPVYSPLKTITWLRWLARTMLQGSQTVFLIEELQPRWLITNRYHISKQIYLYLTCTRIFTGIVVSLIVVASLRISSSLTIFMAGPTTWGIFGYTMGIISGLSVGLGTLISDFIRLYITNTNSKSTVNRYTIAFYILFIAIISCMIVLPFERFTEAFLVGMSNGLIFGLMFGLRENNRNILGEIQTVEQLGFSWKKALRHFFPVLLIGMIVGYIFGQTRMLLGARITGSILSTTAGFVRAIFSGFIELMPNLAVAMAIIVGLAGGIAYGILGGLTGGQIEIKSRPNQGIQLSIRNSLYIGVITSLGFGLLFSTIISLAGWYIPAVIGGVLSGIFFGTFATLWHGGIDAIRHFMLRGILHFNSAFPFVCVPFLDTAVEQLLLRKVGGGYIFLHQYLLEHIASLNDSDLAHLSEKP